MVYEYTHVHIYAYTRQAGIYTRNLYYDHIHAYICTGHSVPQHPPPALRLALATGEGGHTR